MNQQSTQRALLKCQKINKRRHKDETKVLQLLERNLRDLHNGGPGLVQSDAPGSICATTTKRSPQLDALRVSTHQDFKCDFNQRSTLGRTFVDNGYPSHDNETTSAKMLQGSSKSDYESKGELRVPIDVMLHYTCQSHQNAVNMAKAVTRVMDLLRQNSLRREESPLASSISPQSEYARGSQKSLNDQDDQLRSNQKLSHNKQPIHNDEDDGLLSLHMQAQPSTKCNNLSDKWRALNEQQNMLKHNNLGIKCIEKLRPTNVNLEEDFANKYSNFQNVSNTQEPLNKQYRGVQNRTSQNIEQSVAGQANAENQVSSQTQNNKNSTPQTVNPQALEDSNQIVPKKRRGRPPKKPLLPLIIQSPMHQNLPQNPTGDSQTIAKVNNQISNFTNKPHNAPPNINDSTRPTEKHDSEEKALLSKEPIPSVSNESSHVSIGQKSQDDVPKSPGIKENVPKSTIKEIVKSKVEISIDSKIHQLQLPEVVNIPKQKVEQINLTTTTHEAIPNTVNPQIQKQSQEEVKNDIPLQQADGESMRRERDVPIELPLNQQFIVQPDDDHKTYNNLAYPYQSHELNNDKKLSLTIKKRKLDHQFNENSYGIHYSPEQSHMSYGHNNEQSLIVTKHHNNNIGIVNNQGLNNMSQSNGYENYDSFYNQNQNNYHTQNQLVSGAPHPLLRSHSNSSMYQSFQNHLPSTNVVGAINNNNLHHSDLSSNFHHILPHQTHGQSLISPRPQQRNNGGGASNSYLGVGSGNGFNLHLSATALSFNNGSSQIHHIPSNNNYINYNDHVYPSNNHFGNFDLIGSPSGLHQNDHHLHHHHIGSDT